MFDNKLSNHKESLLSGYKQNNEDSSDGLKDTQNSNSSNQQVKDQGQSSSELENNKQEKPLLVQATTKKDQTSKTIYWIFVVYGFSILLNYNAVISTLDFLNKAMPGHNPSFFVGMGLQLFVALTVLFVIIYGHLVKFHIKNNLMILIQIPISLMIPLSVKMSDSSDVRFYIFIASALALGLFNSWQNCAVYYQASNYPDGTPFAGIFLGMGLAGLLINFLRIANIGVALSFDVETDGFWNAFTFFAINALLQLGAACLVFAEKYNPVMAEVNRKVMERDAKKPKIVLSDKVKEILHDSACAKKELFGLFLVYFTTLTAFPGVTNSCTLTFMKTTGPWFQIFWVTLYNFFDTVGRYHGGMPSLHVSKKCAWILTFSRYAQVVLFTIFAFYPNLINLNNSMVGDVVKVVNLAIFGLGNGYLVSLYQIWAPQKADDPSRTDNISTMLVFIINIGITAGCLAQILMLPIFKTN